MTVQEQIHSYIEAQTPAKRDALHLLHQRILALAPDCQLWFLTGRNSEGKVISNENIGYGSLTLAYADGGARDFYRVGLCANTGGISVYIMGLESKTHLADTYGATLGKAKITGYCLKFRQLQDINLEVLEEIIATRLG